MGLVEFLLERIAEDQASAERWKAEDAQIAIPGGSWSCDCGWDTVGDYPFDRVLAECDAKRRTIAEIEDVLHGGYDDDNPEEIARAVLRLLALPYSNHADYEESWAL